MKRNSVFVAAFCALLLLPAQATPSLWYHARACTPGVDCDVSSHGTASGSPAPTNADFQQFFGAELGVDLSGDSFVWSTATNANGDRFGSVDDAANGIHTSYLWQNDHFVCCTIDEPYEIADGNDRGLFIGLDENGASNSGQPIFPAFLAEAGGPLALTPFDYGLTPDSLAFIGNDASSVRFLAIDDGDRILASWSRGWLEFDVVEFNPVPEPATAWLILPVALLLLSRATPRTRTH